MWLSIVVTASICSHSVHLHSAPKTTAFLESPTYYRKKQDLKLRKLKIIFSQGSAAALCRSDGRNQSLVFEPRVRSLKTIIDRELKPFCTFAHCVESFHSIARLSREVKRAPILSASLMQTQSTNVNYIMHRSVHKQSSLRIYTVSHKKYISDCLKIQTGQQSTQTQPDGVQGIQVRHPRWLEYRASFCFFLKFAGFTSCSYMHYTLKYANYRRRKLERIPESLTPFSEKFFLKPH